MLRRYIWGICVLLTMATIFMFSSQNYTDTMKTSDTIVKQIENTIKKDDSVSKDAKGKEDKNLKNKLDKAVRKTAHSFIFGILAVFTYLFLKSCGLSDADAIILTLLFCGIYAGTDEFHQKFVQGRDSRFTDVCIDVFGTSISLILVRFIICIKKSLQAK